MQIFESNTHRAEISEEGILDVFPLGGRKIQEISFDGDNVTTLEHTAQDGSPILKDLLRVMDKLPLFRAAFAQNDVFHLDYETGTQRWKGYKTTGEVRKALIKCNFNVKDINYIINICKRTKHMGLPKIG
jgi:hypothetical protein